LLSGHKIRNNIILCFRWITFLLLYKRVVNYKCSSNEILLTSYGEKIRKVGLNKIHLWYYFYIRLRKNTTDEFYKKMLRGLNKLTLNLN